VYVCTSGPSEVANGVGQHALYADMYCRYICFRTSGWLMCHYLNVPTEVVTVSDINF
jgi:hypothetical protein